MITDKEILADMIECAFREVKRRKTQYPKLVAQGYMTRQRADDGLKNMMRIEALLTEIQRGKSPENIQLRLL